VALALDKKALLESIQLNPEYLSGAISAALNDPDARLVMLKNLINLDKIDPQLYTIICIRNGRSTIKLF